MEFLSGMGVLADPHRKWGPAKPGRNIGSAHSLQEEFFVPLVHGVEFLQIARRSKPEA
jgi:hypothetical protein